jgi:membrane-associated protein
MDQFIHWVIGLGVAAIAFVIYAESGLLIGFLFPGDSLLFTAGFLTQQGVLSVNIHFLAALMFVAAAAGDSTGYAFGRRVGRRLFNRKDSLIFHKDNLTYAEAFYEKHGGKTIILARVMPVIRTFAPIVAGIGKMRYRTFLAYNLIGAFVWGAGITYAGYYIGQWLSTRGINIDNYLIPIALFIILTSILPPVIHVLKDAKGRAQVKKVWHHFTAKLRH